MMNLRHIKTCFSTESDSLKVFVNLYLIDKLALVVANDVIQFVYLFHQPFLQDPLHLTTTLYTLQLRGRAMSSGNEVITFWV